MRSIEPIKLGTGVNDVEVVDSTIVPLMGDCRANTKAKLRRAGKKVIAEWRDGWCNINIATGRSTNRKIKVAVDLKRLALDNALNAWVDGKREVIGNARALDHYLGTGVEDLFDAAVALGYGST
jgi:hypothetical protein